MSKLATLDPESVDLVVTDPPYGIGMSKGYKRLPSIVSGDDGFSVMFFLDEILAALRTVMKADAAIYVFTRFDVMPYWWFRMKMFFAMRNCLVWNKGGIGMGDLTGNYGNSYEMVLYGCKGNHKLRGKRSPNIVNYSKARPTHHETQKPLDLLTWLIEKSSNVGDTVLDPYGGSGSTGIAAVNSGRKFIGFEVDPEICRRANDRAAIAADAGSTSANTPMQLSAFGTLPEEPATSA